MSGVLRRSQQTPSLELTAIGNSLAASFAAP